MTNPCPHSAAAEALFTARARLGLAKYGTTLADAGLSLDRLLLHMQEELADALVYTVAAREVGAWQPIETAPSDTNVLLGWWRTFPKREWKTEAGWAVHSNRMPPESGFSNGWRHGEATHWRPLPAPPRGEK